MMNRENIINSILNESWDDDDRYYNDYDMNDYYADAGFSMSDCDIDTDIDCKVVFELENALEKVIGDIIPERTNEIVARIIMKLKQNDVEIITSEKHGRLLSFKTSYTWNDLYRLEDDGEMPEDVFEEIMNILRDNIQGEIYALPISAEELFDTLEEYIIDNENLIEIEYDVDLEEMAKEDWEEGESIRQSDEADYWSWRRS